MRLIRKHPFGTRFIKKRDVVALVACLGNPGEKYSRSRHNAGFMVGDVLEERSELLERATSGQMSLAFVREKELKFAILRPLSYMNNSGVPTAKTLKSLRLSSDRLIVVHDDIDIPLGEVRIKRGGGTAGHRGIQSIVEALGTSEFQRVRVGVGRPLEGVDPVDYVLGEFEPAEWEIIRVSLSIASDLVIGLVEEAAKSVGPARA